MLHMERPNLTHRKLLLFKWLMVFIPPVTVAAGHVLLEYRTGLLVHPEDRHTANPLVTLLAMLFVTLLALTLAYVFVERLYRTLRKLQAEALAREQDILTMTAVMQERERLSRELHDGAAQLVADLLIRLDTIRELVETERPHEAGAELEQLRGVADEIYEDIGESITGLRTNVTDRGLIRALQDYAEQFEERHQIPTNLQVLTGLAPDAAEQLDSDLAESIPPLIALQLFRLIQEALTNVRKHAAAQETTVTLTSSGPDQLKVVIADDGQGFTPDRQRVGNARPLGLTTMRERVESLGGTFQVKSQPGSGTQVTATIPIPRMRRERGHAAFATPAD